MYILTLIIQIVLLVSFLWTCGTVLHGLLTPPQKRPLVKGDCRFAVLICAHNEEHVVGQLLDSLDHQTYDPALFHMFLFADYCTDHTAQVARRYENVTVLERQEGPRTGKGAVLCWGVEKVMEQYSDRFDHIVIFDADNEADPCFLSALNERFRQGARMVMGNRLPLNPYDNLISRWYSMYWLTVDTLYCQPRDRAGHSSIISGTGFGFEASLLQPEGWHTRTITEDLEFSMQQNFKGVYASYAEDALFYDEQPTTLAAMVSQLRRWCTGNYEIAQVYAGRWFREFTAHFDMRLIDNFIPMLLCVIFGFYFLSNIVWLFYNGAIGVPLFHIKDILWWCMLYVLSVGVGTTCVIRGGLNVEKMLPAILTGGLFCILISLVAVYSVFKPQRKWVPIEHTHGKKTAKSEE